MAERDERAETLRLLGARVDALARLSWEELDAYGEREEWMACPSGRRLRVVTGAFWDMEEWKSGMELYAKAYVQSGWPRRFPYKVWRSRGGPDDLVPSRPPGWRPPRRRFGLRLPQRR